MTWSAKLAPWPSVADAGRAGDFYQSAFGAVEPKRLEGDVGVLQVARLRIGESDFRVQFDPGGNPHALGGSPPVRMILTVDDPTPVGFRNPDVTLPYLSVRVLAGPWQDQGTQAGWGWFSCWLPSMAQVAGPPAPPLFPDR